MNFPIDVLQLPRSLSLISLLVSLTSTQAEDQGGVTYGYGGETLYHGGNSAFSKMFASSGDDNKGSGSSGDNSYGSGTYNRNGKSGVKVIYLPVSVGQSNSGSGGDYSLSGDGSSFSGYSQGDGSGAWSGVYRPLQKSVYNGRSGVTKGSGDHLGILKVESSGSNGDWSGENSKGGGGWPEGGGGWPKGGEYSRDWAKSVASSDGSGGWPKATVNSGLNGWSGKGAVFVKSLGTGDWFGGSGKSSANDWNAGLGKTTGGTKVVWSEGKIAGGNNGKSDYSGLVAKKGEDNRSYEDQGGKTRIIVISSGNGGYSDGSGRKKFAENSGTSGYNEGRGQKFLSQLDLSSVFGKGSDDTSGDRKQDDSDNNNDNTYSSGGNVKAQNNWNLAVGSLGNSGKKGGVVYKTRRNKDENSGDHSDGEGDSKIGWKIGKGTVFIGGYNGDGQNQGRKSSGNFREYVKGKTVIPILISIPESSKIDDDSSEEFGGSSEYGSEKRSNIKKSGNKGLSW